MQKFEWKDTYCIGNDQVDKEHQKLVSLANLVLSLSASGESAEIIRKAVLTLYDYTKTHFAHEEQLMEEIHYEHLEEHRTIHSNIVAEMNRIMKETKSLPDLIQKLKTLMATWVIDHIVEQDTKIGRALAKKAASDF